MWKLISVKIEVKINLGVCLFGLAAILATIF